MVAFYAIINKITSNLRPKMKRIIDHTLQEWLSSPARKPLILRGARQVGKTTAVRDIGKTFTHFVEINFEEEPQLCTVFDNSLDPQKILLDLELRRLELTGYFSRRTVEIQKISTRTLLK